MSDPGFPLLLTNLHSSCPRSLGVIVMCENYECIFTTFGPHQSDLFYNFRFDAICPDEHSRRFQRTQQTWLVLAQMRLDKALGENLTCVMSFLFGKYCNTPGGVTTADQIDLLPYGLKTSMLT